MRPVAASIKAGPQDEVPRRTDGAAANDGGWDGRAHRDDPSQVKYRLKSGQDPITVAEP